MCIYLSNVSTKMVMHNLNGRIHTFFLFAYDFLKENHFRES